MSEFGGAIGAGNSQSWEFYTDDSLVATIEGSAQPYEIDVETKRRSEPDSAYTRIQPFQQLSLLSIDDLQEHTFSTDQVEEETRITVTNNSSERMTVSGRVGGTPRQEYFSFDEARWLFGDKIDIVELNLVQIVDEAGDLPTPTNGVHTLEDNVVYEFQGEVRSDAAIQLGTITPMVGRHRERDFFIYTGGTGAAIRGTDQDFVLSDMSLGAPGATLLNLDGAADSELLVDAAFFADDQELGNMADLGTVTDFRSPDFDQVGLRDFDAGITFSGTVDQVSVDDCVVRDIDASGVDVFTFDSGFTCDYISISNTQFRDVQSDTNLVNVDAAATINEIVDYLGNTHDTTVTRANILTGAAGVEVVGYSVTDSFPLADSAVIGSISADSVGNTITIGSQSAWVEIDDFNTSLGSNAERVSQSSNGTLQYDGKAEVKVEASANMTLVTGGDTVSVAMSVNGTREDGSLQETQSAAGVPIPVSLSSVVTLTTDDEVEVQIRNDDSASNITARTFNLNVTEA